MVVGEAEIEEIIEDDINKVWAQTKLLAGISYSFSVLITKERKKLLLTNCVM